MAGESTTGQVEESSPQTEETEMWIKRLWSWLFGNSKKMDELRGGCKMTKSEFEQILKERKTPVKLNPGPGLKIMAEGERPQGHKCEGNTNSKCEVGPLDLFPEEIWLEVLKKMTPEDRISMFHVHGEFRDLLKSNLIRDALLPLCLNHKIGLVKMAPVNIVFGYPYLGRIPSSYFDRPGKEHYKDLMNLRLVSKSLRDAVDKRFEDRLQYVMRNPKTTDGRATLNTVELNLRENGSRMLQAGRPQRLFLRSLTVNFSVQNWGFADRGRNNLNVRLRTLKENLDELLECMGDQLWHFHVNIGDSQFSSDGVRQRYWESVEQVGSVVRVWLKQMPNVKWLVLETQNLGLRGTLSGRMPRLRKLERFEVTGADLMPVANAIVSANPHVKIHSRFPSYHNGAIQYYTPSVLALPLECVHFGNGRYPCRDLTMPLPVPNSNWNLKRIELHLRGGSTMHSMDAILRFIQRFQTLEDVGLSLDIVIIGGKINFLRLPNLKDFSIEIGPEIYYSDKCASFFSLQFLIHCKNLRYLSWSNRMEDSKCIRRMMENVGGREGVWVDFLEEQENISETNVWDVFPQLRDVKVSYFRMEPGEGGHGQTSVQYVQMAQRSPSQMAVDLDNEQWSISWGVLATLSLVFIIECSLYWIMVY